MGIAIHAYNLINGTLAGCVGITASYAYVSLSSAAIIGVVASFVVIVATVFLDKLRVDDPVGAIPVHLFCRFWGTIAVGLFSGGPKMYGKYGLLDGPTAGLFLGGGFDSLYPQLIGFGAIILTTGIISSIFLICNENAKASSSLDFED
ncbi:MAG: hypothetical protein AAF215_26310 [Cyanobacteria bacterium P01_A01_bin.123]